MNQLFSPTHISDNIRIWGNVRLPWSAGLDCRTGREIVWWKGLSTSEGIIVDISPVELRCEGWVNKFTCQIKRILQTKTNTAETGHHDFVCFE